MTAWASLGSASLGSASLEPSREQAREWAQRELADPAYAQGRPGLVERAISWLLDHLGRLELPSGPGDRTGLVLLVALLVLVAVVVLLRTGALRCPGARRSGAAVLDDERRTSAEHRALADQAAGRRDWANAVRERFRAVARSLEERAILDERPGRTAHEVADEAARMLPPAAAELRAGADVFDDVCYGDRTARAEHDAGLRELDALVARTRPVEPLAQVAP